jgi:hypothetical protein
MVGQVSARRAAGVILEMIKVRQSRGIYYHTVDVSLYRSKTFHYKRQQRTFDCPTTQTNHFQQL